MAPFPQLSAMFGAASPFGCAVRSMNAGNQRQDDAPSNPSIKHAVAALMGGNNSNKVVPAAPAEGGIKMYSQEYYMTCALGGIVSCEATHTAVTPLGRPCWR
eukprot:GHRQ01029715.1.p2 GENE.GHRQ01029715.1~~GHRQ01029715.1.p2  ORF type:complete len:102 (-),score=11.06 GHRQ01029715.1:1210-1515(-)